MATHSSILAWEILRTEEPSYSPWSCKELEGAENKEVTQRTGPSCPQILEGGGQLDLFCI